MAESTLTARVRHQPLVAIIDLFGRINARGEETLYRALDEAESLDPKMILLNAAGVDYINSTGIALIVGLLSKTRESQRKLGIYGVNDHYREIFRITRLAEYMAIYHDEDSALQAVQVSS
jgi:anti-anti-sigma factor